MEKSMICEYCNEKDSFIDYIDDKWICKKCAIDNGLKCKGCGNIILKNLGYNIYCHYCGRKEIMNLTDEEIADEVGRNIFYHEKDWALYEAIRRILLK